MQSRFATTLTFSNADFFEPCYAPAPALWFSMGNAQYPLGHGLDTPRGPSGSDDESTSPNLGKRGVEGCFCGIWCKV